MKLNKWTVGLAAVGAISLSSAVQAEEKQLNVVNAMTSGTTISGYVNTDFSYNLNTAVGGVDRADALGTGKANGFNLDVVNLTIEKPLDESEWAAGYKAELLFGPDAVGWNNSLGASDSDIAIKQAYVNLRTPVGNGIEWKLGVFDTIIGYESFNANANPNYTRSLGWSIEPTQHTGMLGKYQISDVVSVTAGLADTMDAGINNRAAYSGGANSTKDQWNLTYMAAVAVTAPEDMGALKGSTLYGGVLYGRSDIWGAGGNQTSWYTGLTLATGVEGLSVGTAFDYMDYQETSTGGAGTGSLWTVGLYTSFQATEKLSLHARGEYGRGNGAFDPDPTDNAAANRWEGTLTAQYDLWQNVITRLEARWDNQNYGPNFGDAQQGPTLDNAYSIMLNVIYVF